MYGANGLPLNGTVNITINGTSFHPNINVTDGRYNLTIVWNVSGSYTILVQYNGNGTYNRSNATGRLDIALMPTNTTVTNSSGTASTNTTITGTVFADNGVGINGTVNVTVTAPNGSSFTINNVNVTNGQYSLTVVLNSTGNYTVRAVYGGNLTYRNSSSPGAGFDGRIIITAMGSNATVNNPSSRATESVNINGTLRDPSGVNITGNVTVIVTGPSGTHTFNNVSVVNGQYNFNVTMNISGLYNITVNYLGDNTYGPSTARGVLNVSLMPTRVSVNNPTGNATLPVNINGTLLDDNGNRVNGTVNITVGGSTYVVNLTNGNYNLTVTLGANGTYPILVQYFGNGTYAGSINSTGNLYIAYMSSNTIVSNATGIATVPVIINGTVKDANGNNITGLVNITINGPGGPYTFNNVNVTNGAYTLNVTMGSEGIYNILVEYRGNGSYSGSNATGTLNISTMTSGTTVNSPTVKATNPTTITGTVSNGVNGTVDIRINGTLYAVVNVTNGVYSFDITWNVSGVYTIFVNYAGNATFNGSNATGLLTVELMPTNTTVTNGTGVASENTTITGTVLDENNVGITGTVNVTVTGPSGSFTVNNVNVTNGVYNLNVTIGSEGNYTVLVVYGGNGTYSGSNATGTLTIGTMTSGTVVNNVTAKATDPVIITGTVSSGLPVDGFVNITINGTLYANVTVTNGVYVLNVTWNVSGNYTVFVEYGGNATFNGSNATGWLNIELMPTNTTVINGNGVASENTTITGTVYDENNVPITGMVNITIDGPGGPFTFNDVNVINGLFNLTVVLNTTGNYSVRAVYGGNLSYRNSSSRGAGFDGRIVITAMASNATVNNPSAKATESVNINGTLRDPTGVNITGNVTVTLTGPSGTHTFNNVSVVNGAYSLNATLNVSGLYNITVSYIGDDTYGPSTANGILNVSLMPSNATVNNPNGNATVPVNINGTVYDENGVLINGTVNITVDGVTYVVNVTNGEYSLNVTVGAAGNYSVLVVYGGNGTYAGSTVSGSLAIGLMSSNTTVNNPNGTAAVPVNINGTVLDDNGVPINGTVNITVDGVTYVVNVTNGEYSLNVTIGSEGNYTVLVQYGGNGTYSPSNTTSILSISTMASGTVVNNVTAKATDPVSITGTVSSGLPVNGFVNITINGTLYANVPVVNGVYVLNVTWNVSGVYDVFVVYGGNATFNGSNASGWLNITLMPTDTSITNVNGTASDPVTITGKVLDENGVPINDVVNITISGPGGPYIFNNVPVVNGTFTLNVTFNTTGNYSVFVEYGGNATYAGSISRALDGLISISAMASNTTVNNPSGKATDNITINGTVTDKNGTLINGTVNITVDGKTYNVTVTDGEYSLNVTVDTAGDYPVTVYYPGDDTYGPSVVYTTLTVEKMPSITILEGNDTYPGVPTTINGTVTDENGVLLDGSVYIYVNGVYDQVVTAVGGLFNGTISGSKFTGTGNFTITAVYGGNSTYANSSGSNIVIANQIVTTVTVNDSRGRTTETITITGTVDNAYFPINGVVRIIINNTVHVTSESYTAQVINGAYSLSVVYNLIGNYTVEVIYDGDANYTNSNSSARLDVDIMPTTTTVVNNETRPRVEFSSPLVADLVDDNGKAIAGATVLFKVDGTSVGSNVTNAQGRAVFWTSLIQFPVNGTYHDISAEYLGNLTYNASTHSDNILASYMNVTIIIVTPPDTKPGDEVNVTIIIVDEFEHPANDTNITVQIGNDTYNLTTDPNGTVVIPDISSDIATDIPLVVDFVNNSRYNNNTENATLVVEKFNTTIQLGNVELTTLNRTVFSITLVTERGTPIANDEVEIFIDGVSIGKFKTDKDGKIYINHTAYPVGSYEIKAVYSGDEFLYHPTTSVSTLNVRLVKTTITVHRVTSHEDAKTLFVAILVDEFDNPVAFKTISFMVNGMVIGTAMTDANGRAMISYYTYSGDYEVFAEFLEDSIYAGSIDYRTFGVNLMSNETLNETNQTNETLNETNETNTTGKNTPKPVDNNGSDPSDDPDPITLNEELVKSEPAPVGAQMLNTGNPIAILALCLLSILWIGFRRRRKKD